MWFCIYGGYWAILSVCTFVLYVVDKKRAIDHRRRIPEATLLGFSVFGGAAGGYLAMRVVRHKTKHWYFRVINFLGMLAHLALLVYLGVTA